MHVTKKSRVDLDWELQLTKRSISSEGMKYCVCWSFFWMQRCVISVVLEYKFTPKISRHFVYSMHALWV